MKRIAFAILLAILPGLALAQTPIPKPRAITGDAVKDIRNAITPGGGNSNTGIFGSEKPVANAPCDFTLFTALKAENLLDQIKLCLTAQLVQDVNLALDSATAVKDSVGISCLTPGLAMLKAGQEAAQPVAPPVAPPATTTDVPPINPVTSQPPTFNPRLILLFQKFREFGLAGGPSACKSWVQTTITMNNPILQ